MTLECRYTRTHNWIEYGPSVARVGITDYGVRLLGDIVFVDVPAIGQRVRRGEALGSIEAVDAFSPLYAPVSGEIVDLNRVVQVHPEQLNIDPIGTWILLIAIADQTELEAPLDAREYASIVRALSTIC